MFLLNKKEIPGCQMVGSKGILKHTYEIQKDGNDDPICETAKETQM